MRPRLRHGKPLGQYLHRSSSNIDGPIYACWCNSCAKGSVPLVRPDGSIGFGQHFYSEYAIQEHLAETRLSEQQNAKYDPPEGSHTVSPSPELLSPSANPAWAVLPIPDVVVSPSISSPLPQKNVDEAVNSFSNQQPQSAPEESNLKYEWHSLMNIDAHLTNLDDNPLRFWNPTDIQFRDGVMQAFPADAVDLSSLVSDHSSNSPFIGHAEWLHRAHISLCELHPCGSLSVRFSLKHKVVKHHLERVVEATRAALQKEWEKQCKLSNSSQERVDATGMYVHSFPWLS